jgi:hypothetical protein
MPNHFNLGNRTHTYAIDLNYAIIASSIALIIIIHYQYIYSVCVCVRARARVCVH